MFAPPSSGGALVPVKKRLPERFKEWLLPALDRSKQPPPEDVQFMPAKVAAFFLSPPRANFLIVRYTLVLVVLAVVWACFSTLDEITNAEGKVIPSSHVQVIQNLEGGIVSKIHVKVGEVVKRNQIILQLDETRFASSAGETKAKNDALQAKIARLVAESNGADAIDFPSELQRDNPAAVADELALFGTRKYELAATIKVLQEQVSQRNQELVEKRSNLAHLTSTYQIANKELQMSIPLQKQGVVSEVEILRLQRDITRIRSEMDGTRLAIPRLQSQSAEASQKLTGAVAKFRSDASGELARARAELAGSAATGLAAEDRLARTTIRSPVDGVIKTLKINTVGGVIQPGVEVMEIVPIEDNLLIEAKVRPSDVGFLRPGQTAMVKVTAYDFSVYGGLDATVENITADSITNEKGESFYLVQVRTTKNHLGTEDKPLAIIPGMMSNVSIKTGQKSLMSYLLKPILKTKNSALTER
jgi:adhesin transport system membrane fusion protein